MAVTLIDQIETVTGKLSIRRANQRPDVPDQKISDWGVEFLGLCGKVALVPPKPLDTGPVGHIRPSILRYPYPDYIYQFDYPSPSASHPEAYAYYCRAARDIYWRVSGSGAHDIFMRYLLKHLLYCHSIAIDDPLTSLIEYHRSIRCEVPV